jgi:hypothetical protein
VTSSWVTFYYELTGVRQREILVGQFEVDWGRAKPAYFRIGVGYGSGFRAGCGVRESEQALKIFSGLDLREEDPVFVHPYRVGARASQLGMCGFNIGLRARLVLPGAALVLAAKELSAELAQLSSVSH